MNRNVRGTGTWWVELSYFSCRVTSVMSQNIILEGTGPIPGYVSICGPSYHLTRRESYKAALFGFRILSLLSAFAQSTFRFSSFSFFIFAFCYGPIKFSCCHPRVVVFFRACVARAYSNLVPACRNSLVHSSCAPYGSRQNTTSAFDECKTNRRNSALLYLKVFFCTVLCRLHFHLNIAVFLNSILARQLLHLSDCSLCPMTSVFCFLWTNTAWCYSTHTACPRDV